VPDHVDTSEANPTDAPIADVVLPCLDEARALPWVLERMPAGYRPIVVDNGSRDGSAEVARSLGAHVVHEPRQGFGAACHTGLLAATAELVCFCDCDASLDPSELPDLAALVLQDQADLVLGRRQPTSGAAWPPHARLANRVLAARINHRVGVRVRDLGPMRVARRDGLLALALTDRRSGYPLEMLVRAVAEGWRVREVPVAYRPRVGKSKVTGTVRGTLRAIQDMSAVLAAAGPRVEAGLGDSSPTGTGRR
jgi:glycosyltransferase involved in cell wall biosynthesis